jgi:hypothetical protein
MNKNMNRHGKASTNGESSSHSDKEKMLCEIGSQLHHGLPPDSPKICPLINKKTVATKTYWSLVGNGGMGWLLAVIMDHFPVPCR